ncbi:MAG: bifunctional heptose 7-phosphate kinase/heptose 1-phosphate adenyltransferase [Planctomycetota bacterium]|jgi:rfaE bifunctional protein kinase chain/domain
MNRARLDEVIERLRGVAVAVVGDFCVDRYLHLDPSIRDDSRETGLPIHQVVGARSLPGGAASVLANLAALGVGRVVPVGIIGEDGSGFELAAALAASGVDLSRLQRSGSRATPTYIKPVVPRADGLLDELSRYDVFPREPLGEEEEKSLLAAVREELDNCGALIISDYGEAGKSGVISPAVRDGLLSMARERPERVFFADSRLRVGDFSDCCIKPNALETAALLDGDLTEDSPIDDLRSAARDLTARTRRPVFLTLGERGLIAASGEEARHVPGFPLRDPIDPVGAGDAVTASVTAALAVGAAAAEAGLFGVLAASVTVGKLGECGTASPEEIRTRFAEYARAHPDSATGGAPQ